MNVIFSNHFKHKFENFDETWQLAINTFIFHVKKHGLRNLAGRNKSSALPNPHTKKEIANFNFAQKHCLWHYHIGLPEYVGEHGDMTSQMVLHYIRYDEFIVLVDIAEHPPFKLPEESLLK